MTSLELRDNGAQKTILWKDRPVGVARQRDNEVVVELLVAVPRAAGVALLERLRAEGIDVLHARSAALRFEARAQGWSGGLRRPLVFDGAPPRPFLDELAALLPGVGVELAPHLSVFRRLVATAVSGVSNMTRINVTPATGRDFIVTLPDRPDMIADAVAGTIDVALGVHRRFGEASDYVRTISFDQSSHGLIEGTTAGEAPHIRGAIHLNARYVVASEQERSVRANYAPPSTDPDRRRPGLVPAPWTQLDGTVAHELWHKIEMGWDAQDFATTIEFRKEVGALFGAATIEQVFGDPAAIAQLADGVSTYATTNRLEATAEMFKLWWCGPPLADSVPARFGAIVDRFLPAS